MQASRSAYSSKPSSRLKATFWLDATLLILFCALETVPSTGLVLHEWLGLALVGMIVAHLLLSWAWISSQTRFLVSSRSNRTRVNYALNLCLFALATAVIFSGVVISQKAVPLLTGKLPVVLRQDLPWDYIHDRCSDLILVFAGLHLAINWDWTAAAVQKLFARSGVEP